MSIHASSDVTTVKSTCPYCGVGCGIAVDVNTTSLVGTKTHPANLGRLCVKGTHLLETITANGRLLEPAINGQVATWDEATSLVAKKMQQTIATYGPNSVALYVSGQLLTEDYYVANKLMKGFVGSANIDTNSRLCMSSAVAGYKRAFGADVVPCNYDDLEQTDLLVLIGSNAAWTHPVLFQRMEQAKKRRPDMKVVVIDPRKTDSSALSDLNLHIKSGTDTILFNGLLNYVANNSAVDKAFIASHTDSFSAALASASAYSVDEVSELCDIAIDDVLQFYTWFAESLSAISFYSMGINQSVSGVDNANAIINCHLATGKIGKPGSGPFSITGQPNAMGGREVGGLANMLAAHMDIENTEQNALVARFWGAPNMSKTAGLKALDMFDKVHSGEIKFIWIMATNPVVSMPNRQKIEAALLACETVVVSDTVSKNDTLKFANIVLPATGWSEKDGTVTNSERRISRQRAFFPPTGNARHDWQIISEVAAKLGYADAFAYSCAHDIFAEHAQLSGFENGGMRAFDISGLAHLSKQQYDDLQPIQWPVNKLNPTGTERMFVDGQFFTSNGKAQFIPITPMPVEQVTSAEFPLVLNTGRMRDQWHTMTRTGNAARLHQHAPQAELSMHPSDAQKLGLVAGDLVSLRAKHVDESVILPLNITTRQRVGELFAPIHWSKTWSSHVSIGSLFSDANDAISGQPELKHAAVSVCKTGIEAQGSVFTRQALPELLLSEICDYWVKIKLENGYEYRVALLDKTERSASSERSETHFKTDVNNWFDRVAVSLIQDSEVQTCASSRHVVSVKTNSDALSMLIVLFSNSPVDAANKALVACAGDEICATNENSVTNKTGSEQIHVDSYWLNLLLGKKALATSDIHALLRNQPDEQFTQGKLICSCFSVREKTINQAISDGARSVESLGRKLKCGTNCGSCKSELASMLLQHDEGQLIQITQIEVSK